MNPLANWAKAGLLLVCFGLGWLVNGWRLSAELADVQSSHSRAIARAAAETLTAQQERDALADEKRQRLAGIGTEAAKQGVQNANENERVNTCLRDGSCVLRIRAQCPPAASNVPSARPGGGVDTPAPAVLAPETGQAYTALRAGILETERVLRACQASLGVFTGQSIP